MAVIVALVAMLLLQLLPELRRQWAVAAAPSPCGAVMEASVWADEILPPRSRDWVELLQALTSQHLDGREVRKAGQLAI
jgi:hypothetical protein